LIYFKEFTAEDAEDFAEDAEVFLCKLCVILCFLCSQKRSSQYMDV
jgi:hypothetical protein